MCRALLLVLFVLADLQDASSQKTVDYLQSAIADLKSKMSDFNANRDSTVPMLALTKSELAALYEAALAKDSTVTLGPYQENTPYIKAVVHELDDEPPHEHKAPDHGDDPDGDDTNGYYYYYYPINTFMDESPPSPHKHEDLHTHHVDHHHLYDGYKEKHPHDHHPHEDNKIQPHFHEHTHQHNVHITAMKEKEKKTAMEPLFMAVSSFIGMAVMFILSVFFLPKFGGLKSRGVKPGGNAEMTSFGHVILKAIEGHDCSERIACELGKTAKGLRVYDNRFVKLFRRISPKNVGWYIDGITKYARTNLTCAAIRCRRKGLTKIKTTQSN